MATSIDLQFNHGEDWLVELSCLSTTGAPLDVTGATATLCVGLFADPVVEIAGVVKSPGSGGIIDFRLAGSAQTTVRPGVYPYTARVVLSDGSVTDQADGEFTIRAA